MPSAVPIGPGLNSFSQAATSGSAGLAGWALVRPRIWLYRPAMRLAWYSWPSTIWAAAWARVNWLAFRALTRPVAPASPAELRKNRSWYTCATQVALVGEAADFWKYSCE